MIHLTQLDETLAKPGDSRSFEGSVRMLPLVGQEQSKELELLAVYFSAGARTRPHVHEKDQVLMFIRGKGIVATETESKTFKVGHVVTVPRGTWHWHGATQDEAMVHISIRQPGTSDWNVDMKDWEEYNAGIEE